MGEASGGRNERLTESIAGQTRWPFWVAGQRDHTIRNDGIYSTKFLRRIVHPLVKGSLVSDIQGSAHRCGFIRGRQGLEEVGELVIGDCSGRVRDVGALMQE